MAYVTGSKTFTAGEAIAIGLRVKMSGADVVLAGSGEQHIGTALSTAANGSQVAIKLRNDGGTTEVVAAEPISAGTVVYGAAAGKVKDTSAGSAIGVVIEAATADGDVIEMVEYAVLSTTAATVSIADAGNYTTEATVEAALQEIYSVLTSAQGFIPVPLLSIREVTAGNVANIAGNGGLLASDTTPVLSAIATTTNMCQSVMWAASNNDPVLFQVALPPDLDDTADLVVHLRIVSAGTTNAVGFTSLTFFNEGGTSIADTSETNQTATWAEKLLTIAAADVPAGAQTMSCQLTPVAHTTDTLSLSAIWIEYKRKLAA